MSTSAVTPAKSTTPSPKSPATSIETKSVTLQLPTHIHDHFTAQAAADDRTLTNLLVRKIKNLFDLDYADVVADE